MISFIDATFGALLLGGFCSAALSGVVTVQTFLYIRLSPHDFAIVKAMVGAVWTFDTAHSLLIYASIWIYLITNYGNGNAIDMIPIPLALTVLTTAIVTFIVHCFFSYRIYKLSQQRWQYTGLIVVLAIFRLCCATVSTAEMIYIKYFSAFTAEFRWIFTLGLALSCLVDILITGFLTYSLQTLQSEQKASTSLDRIIGTVVMYTFETNLLTSASTIITMICWLTMANNLIFMALHFLIGKLYANSLLATLNTRKQLQQQRKHDRFLSTDFRAAFPRFSTIRRVSTGNLISRSEAVTSTKLEITVQKTIEVGEEPSHTQYCERQCGAKDQEKGVEEWKLLRETKGGSMCTTMELEQEAAASPQQESV